jgi:hypothetical protein
MDDWAKQRLAELHAAAPTKRKRVRSYVRIPLELAGQAAAATGGKRMLVWMLILYRSWQRQNPTVVLPNTMLRKYGISREVKRRALKQLEAAGLIKVQWRSAKNPIVTLATVYV